MRGWPQGEPWQSGAGIHDLVISGGLLVDGSGGPPRLADIAVRNDMIVDVGRLATTSARRVINAEGRVVTPGFVDIHTHYDGQATWDPDLKPSSLHGVTSLAMGNCGVGFAPARPDRHDWLIGLLEGVEDIPGTALAEGLTWDWETFPQYLDALDRREWTVDVGVHVPHAALRTYVMGERGAETDSVATDGELAAMSALLAEGLEAGAVGFATSRTEVHRTSAGHRLGTLTAPEAELVALGSAMAGAGRGVIQLISDLYQTADDALFEREVGILRHVVETSRRPLSMTMQQAYHTPQRWVDQMAWVDQMVADGHQVTAQVAVRPIGVLLGWSATANPFMLCPSVAEIAHRPIDELAVALRDPERRRRILDEHESTTSRLPDGLLRQITSRFDVMFALDDPAEYDLSHDRSLSATALRAGRPPAEFVYDRLADDPHGLLYLPLFNFADGTLDVIRSMLTSPNILVGLSDAGAHCGAICDASMPTSALTLWGRDRTDDRIPIETIVHLHTRRNAVHLGWQDRGLVAPGFRADINVIDLDRLACRAPRLVHDLPAGGRRLVQESVGYVATVKSGRPTVIDGELTNAHPGRLVRGGTHRLR